MLTFKKTYTFTLTMKNKVQQIYSQILEAKAKNHKLLAVLLDPDKIIWSKIDYLIERINRSPATHVFIGGSHVESNSTDELILKIKQNCLLPIVLFPGNPSQISKEADGILFLSLLSGRNADYLIEHQVKAAPVLKQSQLEIIATGYILIKSGKETAVERVSKTTPIERDDFDLALATAQAGEMLGSKLIYLEAGSGAKQAVPLNMIELVSRNIEIPLIVGGGIVSLQGIENAYKAGADLVVIGTAFENNLEFFNFDKI